VKFSPSSQPESNPTLQAYTHNGIIHLLNPNQVKGELRIISANAVTVFTTIMSGADHQEFKLRLPTGIYIIQLITGDEVRNVKVIL
jgi:hypothetical protein